MRVPRLAPPGGAVSLPRDAARHLTHVLRIRRGERLVVFDGEGLEAEAVVERIDRDGLVVRVTGTPTVRRAVFPLHLLLGVPKGPAMDEAVRMATEAGVTHLHPVHTERAVPRGERVDRWERIAVSAAEQCGRADVPVISPPAELDDALRAVADVPDRRVAVPGAARRGAAEGPAAVLVGPEGGLTEPELRRALAAGFEPVGLGPFVLRACTAAAVAVAATAALPEGGSDGRPTGGGPTCASSSRGRRR